MVALRDQGETGQKDRIKTVGDSQSYTVSLSPKQNKAIFGGGKPWDI